jgi:hypothetical protein
MQLNPRRIARSLFSFSLLHAYALCSMLATFADLMHAVARRFEMKLEAFFLILFPLQTQVYMRTVRTPPGNKRKADNQDDTPRHAAFVRSE